VCNVILVAHIFVFTVLVLTSEFDNRNRTAGVLTIYFPFLVLCCDHVLLYQELVRSFHACNKSKCHTSVPDSGGGGDSPPQSIPSEDAKPKKSLHTVPSSASLYGTDIAVEEHRQLVESIARHIVYGESLYGRDIVTQGHLHVSGEKP
jgi:hypothetical protein